MGDLSQHGLCGGGQEGHFNTNTKVGVLVLVPLPKVTGGKLIQVQARVIREVGIPVGKNAFIRWGCRQVCRALP